MAGPFCPLAQLLHAAPAAASASIVAAVGRSAPPPCCHATVAASATVDLTFGNFDDDSDDSGICEVVAGNKGKTPFVCLTGDILRVMQD